MIECNFKGLIAFRGSSVIFFLIILNTQTYYMFLKLLVCWFESLNVKTWALSSKLTWVEAHVSTHLYITQKPHVTITNPKIFPLSPGLEFGGNLVSRLTKMNFQLTKIYFDDCDGTTETFNLHTKIVVLWKCIVVIVHHNMIQKQIYKYWIPWYSFPTVL